MGYSKVFIQITGTLTILFILNWRLSLIAVVCYVAMFAYIRFSGRRSKSYFSKQQEALGDLDDIFRKWSAARKLSRFLIMNR